LPSGPGPVRRKAAPHTARAPPDPGRCPATCDRAPETPPMQPLRPQSKARSAVSVQTTPSSSCRLSRSLRLDGAKKTIETFWKDAAQLRVHMLSSRDARTSSVEQNLDGKPPWNSRESAGPDDKGHSSNRSLREWVKLTQARCEPNCVCTLAPSAEASASPSIQHT